jgi:hypothetical protein
MKLTSSARQYVKIRHAERVAAITRERDEKIVRLRREARGGECEAAITKAHLDCIDSMVKTLAESYIDAYEKPGIAFDISEANEVSNEIQALVNAWFSNLRTHTDRSRLVRTYNPDCMSIVGGIRQSLVLKAHEVNLENERKARNSKLGHRPFRGRVG